MGTRSVRLEEDVYERVMAAKRDEETVSEAIERLLEGPSLSTLAGILSDEEAGEYRDVLERVDEDARSEMEGTIVHFESEGHAPDDSAGRESRDS